MRRCLVFHGEMIIRRSFGDLHGLKPSFLSFLPGLSSRRTCSAMVEIDTLNGIISSEARSGVFGSDSKNGNLGSGSKNRILGSESKNGFSNSGPKKGSLDSDTNTGISWSDAKNVSSGSKAGKRVSDSDENTRFSDSDANNRSSDSDSNTGISWSDTKDVISGPNAWNGISGSDASSKILGSDVKNRILRSDASDRIRDSEPENGILASNDARNRRLKKLEHPPWPEWKLFLDHLKTFEKLRVKDDDCEIFNNDSMLLKHAIVKFARIHESILERLPLNDLNILVNHIFSQKDETTIGAVKRLQIYLQMKENNALPSDCYHLGSAKLKDVMRLIYKAVVGFRVYFVGGMHSDTKHALLRLLQALVSLSGGTTHSIPSYLRQFEVIEKGNEIGSMRDHYSSSLICGTIEWTCSRCLCVNIYGKESCLQCNKTGPLQVQHQGCAGKNTFEKISLCLGEDREPIKFQNLKERVDARKARLERERIQKKAASASSTMSFLPLVSKGFKKAVIGTQVHDVAVARNFQALDAIVESVDLDDDFATQCNGQNPSLRVSDETDSNRLPLSPTKKGENNLSRKVSAKKGFRKAKKL